MPAVDLVIESGISTSTRARQLSAIFDVPIAEKCRLTYKGDLPIENFLWNVGMIVGPSGSGKSTLLKHVFGEPETLDWSDQSVIDDFPKDCDLETITSACQSVGFNTIPAWLRPYEVLSTGEKFRVTMARHIVSQRDPILIDEFTSVIDRQVAKICSHAIQKKMRRDNRKLVVATCHYDVIDWLQPDWVFEPATMKFTRRNLQLRPKLQGRIDRVTQDAWKTFSRYHYLTSSLHRNAKCFVLSIDDKPAAFTAVLHRPNHGSQPNIKGITRNVTLPDFQGMGLIFVLADTLGSMYRSIGYRLRAYPAHPPYIRSHAKNNNWLMVKKPGYAAKSAIGGGKSDLDIGTRPCAIFEYVGPAFHDKALARAMLE